MIEVTLNQPEFEYDIHSLIKAFYPSEYVGVSAEKKEYDEPVTSRMHVEYTDDAITLRWQQGEFPLCNVCRKADLLIRRKISLLHIRIDLVPAFSLFEQLHRNLGRPDSRERSPRQILTGRIRQKRIQILFQPVLRLRAV